MQKKAVVLTGLILRLICIMSRVININGGLIKVIEPKKYSFWFGLWKTLKNALIFLLPSLVALETSIPGDSRYAAILSIVVYIVKNYLENRNKGLRKK